MTVGARTGRMPRVSEPMRVLIAHNRYRRSGGEERAVELLATGLSSVGVDVARFEPRSPLQPSLPLRVSLAAGLAYRPAGGRATAARVTDFRADVVHFHNLFPLLTPAALRAAKRGGAAVVLTAHNCRLFCPSGMLVRGGSTHEDCITGSSLLCGLRGARQSRAESVAYGLALEIQRRLRLVERWVDAIITPSVFLQRTLVDAGFDASRIHVVPNGVPVPGDEPKAHDFALYAGRLSHEKGILTLLAASGHAPEVPIILAGDGPLTEQVGRAASPSVTTLGHLDPASLAALLRKAAFVVVPSEVPEIQPYSVLEAMADAKPVVLTAIGGLPELVTSGVEGIVVAPGEPQGLARALRLLWANKSVCAEMGDRARGRVVQQHTLEAHVAATLDVYERALARSTDAQRLRRQVA